MDAMVVALTVGLTVILGLAPDPPQ